jgi:hypothetical protein
MTMGEHKPSQSNTWISLGLAAAALLNAGCGGQSAFKAYSSEATSKQCLPSEKPELVSGKLVRVDDMVFFIPATSGVQEGAAYSLGPALNKWPGGVVPLKFSGGISETQRQLFYAACEHWSAGANVRCVPYVSQANYLSVTSSSFGGNYSGYGAFPGTELNIAPASWNSSPAIIHELGHALGLMHEHQRADRDQFIEVHFGNIGFGLSAQFNKISEQNSIGPYDFYSIMHYDANAFSSNGQPTMTVRPGYEAFADFGMYKRTTISSGDRLAMSTLYGAPVAPPPQPDPMPNEVSPETINCP